MAAHTRLPLTVVALAWNEATHLEPCFRSVEPLVRAGADTLIVLDSQADEEMETIARRVAQRVVVSNFVNFAIQRNKGLDLAETEWVFFIDADERCTPRLAQEIRQAIRNSEYAAYRVPRRNILFGHEVRHTGWSPDYQIRLLERQRCRYDESREVHELPQVDGKIGTLSTRLVHYNYATWRQFVSKQRAYAVLEARALYAAGRRARPRSFIGQPFREFKCRFIEYKGFKDGLLGFILSAAMGLYAAETQRQLLLLQNKRDSLIREG
ncbi:MAG TPA: glycosyltransferase family 2 protein [Chloroflexia bacterium]